jgi:hypothetical protein
LDGLGVGNDHDVELMAASFIAVSVVFHCYRLFEGDSVAWYSSIVADSLTLVKRKKVVIYIIPLNWQILLIWRDFK